MFIQQINDLPIIFTRCCFLKRPLSVYCWYCIIIKKVYGSCRCRIWAKWILYSLLNKAYEENMCGIMTYEYLKPIYEGYCDGSFNSALLVNWRHCVFLNVDQNSINRQIFLELLYLGFMMYPVSSKGGKFSKEIAESTAIKTGILHINILNVSEFNLN